MTDIDIVKRLRKGCPIETASGEVIGRTKPSPYALQAADEIERLRAQIPDRAALEVVLEELEAQINAMGSHIEKLTAQIPDRATLGEVLSYEQQRAKLNGLDNCTLAGPGRGDCWNFVGLPGKSIPDHHDGPDDTVDEYGKPNGWCWSCWKSEQIERLRAQVISVMQERQLWHTRSILLLQHVPDSANILERLKELEAADE